jgi:S1-C subfamily serine protease
MKRLVLALAFSAAGPALAASAAEQSYFQRTTVFSFVGEDEALGSKVSVFYSKSVKTSESERRASVAWAFRESVTPVPNIRIDSTEWTVTADCSGRVIAFERFEDGDSYGRIRRAGSGALWAAPDSDGLPRLLLPDLFRMMCGDSSSQEQITVLALGSREPPPAVFAAPARREPIPQEPDRGRSRESMEPQRRTSTGTGFFTAPTLIITNHHVVAGCTSVTLRRTDGSTTAGRVVDSNESLDLAGIRVTEANTAPLTLRGGVVEVGETVVTFGFPLSGLLSDGGVATTGIVSALSGMRNDSSRIQITAPIQPGNSGGPLLDDRGQVVGVVVSKLNALRIADAIGDVPQNVNFAVSLQSLKTFLQATTTLRGTPSSATARPTKDIVRAARTASVLVSCTK